MCYCGEKIVALGGNNINYKRSTSLAENLAFVYDLTPSKDNDARTTR